MLRQLVGRVMGAKDRSADLAKGSPEIAILGAGAGGLCLAMRLKEAGVDSFTVYEKSEGVGGTWRDNTYPGACCDVKSHLYSFSFEPNPNWTQAFAQQREILEYLERCAENHELYPHIRFGTEISGLTFDEEHGSWRLTTSAGDGLTADVVVSALGQLNRPVIPDIAGLDRFGGTMFHSARWDHHHDLSGERVAVVGNAASALQFVPEIAPCVEHLDVYQRSPNWVLPKPNPRYSDRRRWAFREVPGAQELQRASIYWSFEARYLAFRHPSRLGKLMEGLCRRYLATEVEDPVLRGELTPDYPLGCKRILASNDYYAALARPDVDLVTSPIERFVAEGVITADGVLRSADTVIFATGFDSTHFLAPLEVVGRRGQRLEDRWREGAEAHLGMTVSGFPNLFMLYGPNTNLGHNSILFMIECQVEYILRCLGQQAVEDVSWFDVRPDVVERYNEWVQESMKATVWDSGCQSWYKHESGKVTNNWPRTTVRYWFETLRSGSDVFQRGPRRPPATPTGPSAAAVTGS